MSEKKASPQAEQRAADNHQQSSNKKDNLLHKYSFAAILIIAAIVLAAASSWLSYRFHHNVGELAEDVEKLSTHIDQLQDQMTAQSALLKKVEATNDSLRTRLVARDNPARWQIAEALYFTRLANDSLQFHHDIKTGKQLLALADDRLRSSGESGVAPIRQSLTQIIEQLNALPPVDTVGLYSKLNALADSVAQLTPLPEIEAMKKKASAASQNGEGEPATTSSWRQGLSHSMERVWKLIIIQRRDQAITPLLTNQQYQQLNDTLLLLIRQAQWAILYRQPTIYHASLQQLTTLLKRYYGGNSQQVKPLLTEINQLNDLKIDVTPPSLSSLIDAMTQYINQQSTSFSSEQTTHSVSDTSNDDSSQSVQQQVSVAANASTNAPTNLPTSNNKLATTQHLQGDKVVVTGTKTSDDNQELSI